MYNSNYSKDSNYQTILVLDTLFYKITIRVESAIMGWVVLWETACKFNALIFKSINF